MNNLEKSFASVVIYGHNAEKDIVQCLSAIETFLRQRFESYEMIYVDDASTDTTESLLKHHGPNFSGKLTVIRTAWKHGNEMAMLAGTNLAIGDFVFEIESTHMEFPIETLWDAFEKCGEGYDIVFAAPKWQSNITSKLFYKILERFSRKQLDLETDSFKLITRRALNTALRSKERIRYRKILYKNSGFPTATIHFFHTKPIKSDRTFGEKFSFATETLLAFSDISLKITLWLSFLFFVGSIIIGAYTIAIYLTDKSVALGWTTTMLFLSFSFSGIFLILTILGKYLTMILEESKKADPYTIQSISRLR